jgi:hypothetical protein
MMPSNGPFLTMKSWTYATVSSKSGCRVS